MDWLSQTHADNESVEVSYLRAGSSAVTVAACVAEQSEEVATGSHSPPARAENRWRSYFIRVDDLVAAGVSGVPLVSDRITETLNGVAKTFELVKGSDNRAYEYSDAERTTYRVFCRPTG